MKELKALRLARRWWVIVIGKSDLFPLALKSDQRFNQSLPFQMLVNSFLVDVKIQTHYHVLLRFGIKGAKPPQILEIFETFETT